MMADEMKKAVKLDPNLDREERRLLGKAFNRSTSVRRAAWKTLLLAEQRGSVYAKDEDLQQAWKAFISQPSLLDFAFLQAARRSVVCQWKNSCLSQSDFQTRGDVFFAVDILAMLVKKMKESAEQFLDGKTVTVAVITVSTYFDESQRHAIKDAGEKSGILDKLLPGQVLNAFTWSPSGVGQLALPKDPQPRPEPYRWPTQAKRAGTSGFFVQLNSTKQYQWHPAVSSTNGENWREVM
ncbi:hypothetical protein niasHT_014632 [Heterodera trifolii]|uniref:Uncharacterized protein n=1 Tax=Heterodera trifolii TaxID=157864 RepID=A0ABD2LHX2_9BILA